MLQPGLPNENVLWLKTSSSSLNLRTPLRLRKAYLDSCHSSPCSVDVQTYPVAGMSILTPSPSFAAGGQLGCHSITNSPAGVPS